MTSYLDIENSQTPITIKKDICLNLSPRGVDSTSRLRLSLRNLFSSNRSNTFDEHSNAISAIYEMKLNKHFRDDNHDSSSPGVVRRTRKVVDTSNVYVRGEEMLHGWRPRRDSLIIEHQQELEKLYKIQCVCRFFFLSREIIFKL